MLGWLLGQVICLLHPLSLLFSMQHCIAGTSIPAYYLKAPVYTAMWPPSSPAVDTHQHYALRQAGFCLFIPFYLLPGICLIYATAAAWFYCWLLLWLLLLGVCVCCCRVDEEFSGVFLQEQHQQMSPALMAYRPASDVWTHVADPP